MKNNKYESKVFEDLNFTNEVFENYQFKECHFINCAFEECTAKAILLSDCIFENCIFLNLKGKNRSQMQNIEFKKCQILGINWQDFFSDVIFVHPIARFKNCSMKYNTFFDIDFKKFDFSGNEILHSLFNECELGESNFKNTRLDRTEFIKCNLKKADLREAKGYNVDILTCKLKAAKFSMPEVLSLLNALEIEIN